MKVNLCDVSDAGVGLSFKQDDGSPVTWLGFDWKEIESLLPDLKQMVSDIEIAITDRNLIGRKR